MEGRFDLINSRLLLYGMSDWPRYIRTVTCLLKPSTGRVEIHDLDWVWYDSSNNIISDKWEWVKVLREAAEERGLDVNCGSRAAGWMKDAGLVNVKAVEYYCPFGGEWEGPEEMKAFGEYVASEMPRMFTHVISKVTERKGYSKEQIEARRAQR
ncbi:hypothetical protein K469DRAFT_721552 [Zopfia rhizophila CBS 207.26]|uniref:Methyltransferase type 11 domain-containing protein n=1 Tax=Zopfia rhizophila CBS 207.26 TaxID=1314779 RepID=A0A6A6EKM9_9PEZI|nr:hypothetical protein K469DRAFT_721552 [Zopfia rhizophila CBS 207.26]